MDTLVQTQQGSWIPACPWLPAANGFHHFEMTRRHGSQKGAEFYLDALCYAQSLWMSGKPAQAILQLNKAWMADLSENPAVLRVHPPPYRALVWILENAQGGKAGFLGNPVRHFQHLASRMSGPQKEIRTWRAWACFYLAVKVLHPTRFPRDGHQIAKEGLWIPGRLRALNEIRKKGWHEESEILVHMGY